METLRAFARNLGPVRLAVLAGVTLALAGFFVWMIARTTAAPQALLFGDLEATDAARIVSQLEAAKIPYQLGNGGTAVFVAAEQVARTRMQLAEQGLPSGGSIGYEIFDKSDALGSTNFQQNVNLVRALEGELARTIRSIGDVRSARVHLVLPRRELLQGGCRRVGDPSRLGRQDSRVPQIVPAHLQLDRHRRVGGPFL